MLLSISASSARQSRRTAIFWESQNALDLAIAAARTRHDGEQTYASPGILRVDFPIFLLRRRIVVTVLVGPGKLETKPFAADARDELNRRGRRLKPDYISALEVRSPGFSRLPCAKSSQPTRPEPVSSIRASRVPLLPR